MSIDPWRSYFKVRPSSRRDSDPLKRKNQREGTGTSSVKWARRVAQSSIHGDQASSLPTQTLTSSNHPFNPRPCHAHRWADCQRNPPVEETRSAVKQGTTQTFVKELKMCKWWAELLSGYLNLLLKTLPARPHLQSSIQNVWGGGWHLSCFPQLCSCCWSWGPTLRTTSLPLSWERHAPPGQATFQNPRVEDEKYWLFLGERVVGLFVCMLIFQKERNSLQESEVFDWW